MKDLLADLRYEFRRHKNLADRALATLDDQEFACRPAAQPWHAWHVGKVGVLAFSVSSCGRCHESSDMNSVFKHSPRPGCENVPSRRAV